MCSHGYFHRGNAKQTRTTLKNITNVTFNISTVYVSYILPSTEVRFFSGEGEAALI